MSDMSYITAFILILVFVCVYAAQALRKNSYRRRLRRSGLDKIGDGRDFEEYVAALLKSNGYRHIRTTPKSGDYDPAETVAEPSQGNPRIPAPGFFPIDVISFNATGDALMSGRMKLLNNSDFTLENVYLEIWVSYELPGGAEKKMKNALPGFAKYTIPGGLMRWKICRIQ